MNNLRSKVSNGVLEKENLLQARAEKVEMTLNTESSIASSLLIQRLTELYENPIEATVRETISNALDAITESHSGGTAEIKISTPNTLNPVFVVKDNGVGMTYEDLKNVYSKYGASTKMNNMDQIGAYGLGAKAPLAYGTEFTVTSIKDGQRTTIIVVREELTNYIKIVGTEETTEPTGTTVSIPVSSDDIPNFKDEVEKYKNKPLDKDEVKMVIDGEEVTDGDYIKITNDLVIFNNDEGEVTARVWINKNSNMMTNIFTSASENSFKGSMGYLIGGWVYNNPKINGYYRSSKKDVIIELKSGVVSFNSSRDAILPNDRYGTFEEMVLNYFKSSKFIEDYTIAVNKLDIVSFKGILMKLFNTNISSIFIENNEIIAKLGDNRHMLLKLNKLSLSNFVHSSGFKLNDIISNVPLQEKPIVALYESKNSYEKTSTSHILKKNRYYGGDDKNLKLPAYSTQKISDINEEIRETLVDNDSEITLSEVLLSLAAKGYKSENDNSHVSITFVTDIEAKEYDDKELSKLISRRKSIVKMKTEGVEKTYESHIILTKYSKAEIERAVKNSGLKDLSLTVRTITEIINDVNEYRKSKRKTNSSNSSGKVSQELEVSLFKFEKEKMIISRVTSDDLDNSINKKKKNILIVSKDKFIRNKPLSMTLKWYCNKFNQNKDDVELYYSCGNHRKIDLEILNEHFEEIFEYLYSDSAGTSQFYKDTVDGKKSEMDLLYDDEENLVNKQTMRVIASIASMKPFTLIERLKRTVEKINTISSSLGIETNEYNFDGIEKLGKETAIAFDLFNSDSRDWDWVMSNDLQIKTMNNLSKENSSLVIDIAHIVNENRRHLISGNDILTTNVSLMINNHQIENLISDKNGNEFSELMRDKLILEIKYVTNAIKKLIEIA